MIVRRSVLGLLTASIVGTAAWAGDAVRHGDLEFREPWARATAPRQANAAAFMTIRNTGASADRIVAAKADVSRKVELHTHILDAQGVARMREIPAIELPADSTVKLEPGGLHVMFIDLHHPLEAGRRFPLTLVLEKAGQITLEVEVKAASAGGAMQGHGAHGARHGNH